MERDEIEIDIQTNKKTCSNSFKEEITKVDLEIAIKKIKIGKAPRLGGVISKMFKFHKSDIHERFFGLTESNEDGRMSTKVLYIGNDSGNLQNRRQQVVWTNYKGIPLTSTAGKVYLRILESRFRKLP